MIYADRIKNVYRNIETLAYFCDKKIQVAASLEEALYKPVLNSNLLNILMHYLEKPVALLFVYFALLLHPLCPCKHLPGRVTQLLTFFWAYFSMCKCFNQ